MAMSNMADFIIVTWTTFHSLAYTNKMIVSFQSWAAMKCDAIPLTLHVLLLKSILHPTTRNNTFLLYFLSLVRDVNVRHVFKKTVKYYRNNINVLASCFIVEFNKLYSAIVYKEFCCWTFSHQTMRVVLEMLVVLLVTRYTHTPLVACELCEQP